MASTSALAARRLVSIDALRGIAATGVVLVHAIVLPVGVWDGGSTAIGRAAATLLRLGIIGVYLFFVISGFCIHMQWARQDDQRRAPSFGAFWKRRIYRLYPPYLVALGIFVALDSSHRHFDSWFVLDVGLHLVMAHNLIGATTYSLNLVFWTLALEEQLYLLYFVLLALRRRWGWPATVAVTFAARAAWFGLALVLHRATGWKLPVQEGSLAQWFVWALGAVSVEYALGRFELPRILTRLDVGVLLLVATCTLYVVEDPGGGTLAAKFVWFASSPLLGLSFFVIVNALTRPELGGKSPAQWMRLWAKVGLFSYSLYLVHEIIVQHLREVLVRHFDAAAQRPLIGLALVPAAMVFGWVYFYVVERRFLRPPSASPVPARVAVAIEHDRA